MRSDGLFALDGKVALITGSSQGLGFAIARGLGQAGAVIVLNGRDEEKLQRAVTSLKEEGLNAHGCAFDVLDTGQIQTRVRQAEKEVGPIHILVNNAGIQHRAPLEAMEEAAWRKVIDTNLTAAFLVAREVVQGMIARQSGKIINICSAMSEVGRKTIAPYVASKGGLKMLTKAMAVEWARFNIQANGIGPGYFATELNRALLEDAAFDTWIRSRTPAGRWGDPAELAGTAVYLASSASDFVNGQIIYVDGGLLASI